MAIISGTTVNWTLSPRIIIIPNTVTEVTITDLQDTLLDLEDDEAGIVWPYLRNMSGGEDLGGGVSVGYTMELQNAQLQFEGRTTPDDSGTCTTADSTGTTLIDSAATFITTGITRGQTVFNSTDGSMAAILEVVSETELTSQPLSGGTGNNWDLTDSYTIYPNVLCSISGGNLVAVDDVGASISPVFQSPNTSVIRTSASSATNTNSADLEHSSYNNGVTIDVINGVSGTTHPTGTNRQPVDNLTDASTIAAARGFNRLYIRGDLTLGATDNVDDYIIISESDHQSTITVTSGCSTSHTNFRNSILEGTTNGEVDIHNCVIGTNGISGFSGDLKETLIKGNIISIANSNINILNCRSGIAGTSHPELTVSGTSNTNIRSYVGGLGINGLTAGNMSIDMAPGSIHFHNTCTGGTALIRGIYALTDESNGTIIVRPDEVANIEKLLLNRTHTDPVTGVMTIYDDDDTTVLYTANIWENVAGTTAYSGTAINRKDRFT